MQHDHVLRKSNFDLLTPTLRVEGEGGSADKNICYHIPTHSDSNRFDKQHDHVLKNEF